MSRCAVLERLSFKEESLVKAFPILQEIKSLAVDAPGYLKSSSLLEQGSSRRTSHHLRMAGPGGRHQTGSGIPTAGRPCKSYQASLIQPARK